MYDLIKYVHVICAIIWVGGAFFAQLLAIRASRSDDPADLPKLGRASPTSGSGYSSRRRSCSSWRASSS